MTFHPAFHDSFHMSFVTAQSQAKSHKIPVPKAACAQSNSTVHSPHLFRFFRVLPDNAKNNLY